MRMFYDSETQKIISIAELEKQYNDYCENDCDGNFSVWLNMVLSYGNSTIREVYMIECVFYNEFSESIETIKGYAYNGEDLMSRYIRAMYRMDDYYTSRVICSRKIDR